MNNAEVKTLRVPGANLYYEVYGSGPLLLLIHGGGGGAYVFNQIIGHLANRYSVVTYDRRGLSRSTLDDPEEEQLVERHSDDAHLLLKELSNEYEPAYVFGSSGGAIVGLDLAARYPEQVKTLIAHEPPSHLLPEADAIQEMGAIREIYLREGLAAAFQKLAAQSGFFSDDREPGIEFPSPTTPEERERAVKNLVFLFEHEFAMYDRYQFDFAALKNAMTQTQIVLAGGRTSREIAESRSAVAIADQIGAAFVEFPGNHVGYGTHPRAFAGQLYEVLG